MSNVQSVEMFIGFTVAKKFHKVDFYTNGDVVDLFVALSKELKSAVGKGIINVVYGHPNDPTKNTQLMAINLAEESEIDATAITIIKKLAATIQL